MLWIPNLPHNTPEGSSSSRFLGNSTLTDIRIHQVLDAKLHQIGAKIEFVEGTEFIHCEQGLSFFCRNKKIYSWDKPTNTSTEFWRSSLAKETDAFWSLGNPPSLALAIHTSSTSYWRLWNDRCSQRVLRSSYEKYYSFSETQVFFHVNQNLSSQVSQYANWLRVAGVWQQPDTWYLVDSVLALESTLRQLFSFLPRERKITRVWQLRWSSHVTYHLGRKRILSATVPEINVPENSLASMAFQYMFFCLSDAYAWDLERYSHLFPSTNKCHWSFW